MSTTLTPRRSALPNGVWAIALVIATESAFLGCLMASYFFLGSRVRTWPPAGVAEPHVLVPLVLTGVLVATSVPMFFASRLAALYRARTAWLLILVATAAQAAYLGIQVHLFLDDLDKVSQTASAYGSAYFTLLGAHHTHVAVGILLDLWLLARLVGGLTPYRVNAVRVAAWYWYFVCALGVLVTLTVVSPAL
jgi:cytochrome c oxidase subunit 3/cytochrome c oxidase subunit I+III